MGNYTEWMASPDSRRWRRHKKSNAVARAWLWVIGAVAAASITTATVWELLEWVDTPKSTETVTTTALDMIRGSELAPWQNAVMESIEQAVTEVGQGNLNRAELACDKAGALLAAAGEKRQQTDAGFFQLAVSGLNRIWNQRPENDELFRHVTQARTELAGLRSAQNAANPEAERILRQASSIGRGSAIPKRESELQSTGRGSIVPASVAADDLKARASMPRAIAANSTLSPETLGKGYLDATHMPAMAEIFLPPATRSFDDHVRVENLTIVGGSQTLDGIQWLNVTFVGTHLRYERGVVDLDNVHFVDCVFEFTKDDRGARLANAIALGQTTYTAE